MKGFLFNLERAEFLLGDLLRLGIALRTNLLPPRLDRRDRESRSIDFSFAVPERCINTTWRHHRMALAMGG
jgi:hypothetical protein